MPFVGDSIVDPKLALTRPRRLVDDFQSSVETERLLARLSAMLSGLALLLAAVGLYGVMAYTVRQRTREVGLRLALGATPGVIMQLIVGRGARLIAIGAGLGLLGAAASVRLVRTQLFGSSPRSCHLAGSVRAPFLSSGSSRAVFLRAGR